MALCLGASRCAHVPPPPRPDLDTLSQFEADESLREKDGLGCEGMFDHYCNSLYSPEARGNLRIGRDPDHFRIYRGRTSNDFSATYFFYANAKLDRRLRMPADFRRALEDQGYYQALGQILNRKPRVQMSLEERLSDTRLDYKTGAAWNSAIEETVLQRMHTAHPEFYKLVDEFIPVDLKKEKRKLRRQLISEVSTALWKDHGNWVRVTSNFEIVRTHLLNLIAELDLEDDVRTRWVDRVRTLRLVLPGSLPEIADEECVTTDTNAYYYPRLNVLTICAGDFNSEDIFQTMSHEIAHALDVDSMAHLFRRRSNLGLKLEALEARSCGDPTFDCAGWRKLKNEFGEGLKEMADFEVDLMDLQACLKSRTTTQTFTSKVADRVATEVVAERFAALAEDNAFVRLIKAKLPMPDGKWMPNPNHLNVCRYLSLQADHDAFDIEEGGLLYFVSEYRCSTGSEATRMRNAIAVAKAMATKAVAAELGMLGEFSEMETLNRDGYSASPAERFADLVGSHLLARVLEGLPDRWARRKLYFASSSWQCPKPSLSKAFPSESAVERELRFDSHSAGKARQRENFSQPIRKALACEKDFVFDECDLPYLTERPGK